MIPVFDATNGNVATRAASGAVINAFAPKIPEFVGGSADLAGSTLTTVKGAPFVAEATPGGRNVHFGIREHAMGAMMNGMALHGGVIPYGGTFLIFSDYMRPAIRLAALMKQQAIYVFTHDSIGLGEDGPTHQPVEQLSALRCIPNLLVIRPADANETAEAWKVALKHRTGPIALALTRQKLPLIDRTKSGAASGVARGAYVLVDSASGPPRAVIMASGSEVEIALKARELLAEDRVGVRVVSMPCHELFAQQTDEYRESVLPKNVRRAAIEAAHPMSWYRWVGTDGVIIGIDHFGASAPYQKLYEEFGLTAARLAETVRTLIARA
jgi:transketolase